MKAQNIQINITVNPESVRKLKESFDRLSFPPPSNYGSDDLHNARLIAAFHVRRGAWPEYMPRWKASLGWRDRLFIDAYESRGEWGNTCLALHLPSGGAEAFTRNLSDAFASIGQSFAAVGAQIANAFATGLQPADPEEFLIIVERINLRHNLERILIPATIACWVARRWPAWALPAVAWMWLQRWLGRG